MPSSILLIDCADRPGHIAHVTKCLFDHQCNIIDNREYVDTRHNRFLMRTAFQGEINEQQLLRDIKASLPDDANVSIAPKHKKNIVILVTKEPHCIGDLLVRCSEDDLHADIQAVIGNHDTLAGLVSRFDYPFHHISHRDKSREEHEQAVTDVIDHYQPDYIILAKYMRILSDQFVNQYANRMINIHHSFLPAFIGARPYQQAYDRGVKIIGATAHMVTADLDAGPIVTQNVIHVDHSHSAEDMARFGRDVEKSTLAKAVDLVLQDRVFITGNRAIIFD